jgi:Zn-dependent protease with chaperone function
MSDERFCLASCEHCEQHIEFPADGIGMTVACPHCGNPTLLSEHEGNQPATQVEVGAGELQAAFAGAVPRSRISFFYQIGLLLVAVFMILLPVAYLAFVFLAAYGVYWYAVHALVLFSSLTGGFYGMILRVLLYVGPIVGGSVAVFFMFKPLLARRPKRMEPIQLNPAQHPRVYQFIAHASDVLRVPIPKRIDLDCELSASAGLRRGWLSFLGRDTVLTLGLPLVAGVNTRQLAVVVAHELGHCTQGLAMRLSYVINRVDGWLVRVVYERDTWDESFEEWANSVEDSRVSLIVACAGIAIWLSRQVLKVLMFTGHAVSCFLSRQMEFHADACSMAVAGSATVESALIRLRELYVLQGLAYDGLQQFWKHRHQLPDSLPDFLTDLEARVPAELYEHARLTLLNESAGLWATHPTAAQRIQKARQRAEPGVFQLERPARALFNDFQSTAKLVSARHYRSNLRLAVTPAMLKPVQDFFREDSQEKQFTIPGR